MKKIESLLMRCCLLMMAAFVAVGVASCVDNADDDEALKNQLFVSVGNYKGFDGINYSFEVVLTNGNYITLTSKKLNNKDIAVGARCVISYYITGEQGYEMSGEVEVVNCSEVPTIAIEVAEVAEAEAANAEMNVYYGKGGYQSTVYRTGNYINVNLYLPIIEGRTFKALASDASTLSGVADVYLTTSTPNNDWSTKQVMMVSVDITELWRNPTTTGIRLHINNSNMQGSNQKVFEFKK